MASRPIFRNPHGVFDIKMIGAMRSADLRRRIFKILTFVRSLNYLFMTTDKAEMHLKIRYFTETNVKIFSKFRKIKIPKASRRSRHRVDQNDIKRGVVISSNGRDFGKNLEKFDNLSVFQNIGALFGVKMFVATRPVRFRRRSG